MKTQTATFSMDNAVDGHAYLSPEALASLVGQECSVTVDNDWTKTIGRAKIAAAEQVADGAMHVTAEITCPDDSADQFSIGGLARGNMGFSRLTGDTVRCYTIGPTV